jgi:hypothetical protein
MKRVLFLGLLALALPLAAFANSTTTTQFVAASGIGGFDMSSSGITLNATLIGMNGFNGGGLVAANLGTMSFTTGALLSTSGNTETFAGGGSFTITGNGTDGTPNGVIFSGTFNGPVKLMQFGAGTDNSNFYVVVCEGSCSLTGTWFNGQKATGGLYLSDFNGIVTASTGFQQSAVPEPGTLSMLGTGLLGLGALVRRKLKA